MSSTMLQDTAPVIVDAVRDASKAVGSMIQGPVQKLHMPHVPMPDVTALAPKRRRRRRGRGLVMVGAVALVVACVAMFKRRREDPTQLA